VKLALILPKCYDRKEDEGDTLVLPPLNLPTIAAITPPHVNVKIIDDRVEEIDYDQDVELVGITCITETAGRAYDIAGEFRKRGVPVILGGLHPTMMTEDALEHCDSVLCGEALGIWDTVLADFQQGRLQKVYRNMQPADLTGIPQPRFDLLGATSRYVSGVRLVNATRGCYMRCTFCSTQEFWEGTFRCRPVHEVVEEVRASQQKFIVFVDDDIGGNKKYARELFEALAPLKVYWVSQTRINMCMDEALLGLASKAGCLALFTGFESVSMDTLKEAKKYQNVVANYSRAIDNCHKNRICLEAGFVFGFDTDSRASFQETLKFILDSKLDSININVLHPIPGTPAFAQMDKEQRITTYDWNAWAGHERCLFQPKLMSAEDVEAGSAWVVSRIYTWPRIIRRVVRSFRWARWFAPYYLFKQNLSYKRRRADQWGGGYNPAARPALASQEVASQ
jgi:radical SAM superfamily enzyme YgiQ (UPF0313 family)